MSELGEDFAALKEYLKERRKARELANSKIIWDWCDVNDGEYSELQPWHIRVAKR